LIRCQDIADLNLRRVLPLWCGCGVHKVLFIAIHQVWANGNYIVIDFHHFKALWNMASQCNSRDINPMVLVEMCCVYTSQGKGVLTSELEFPLEI